MRKILTLVAALAAGSAFAQEFPARPIRMIVGYAAGSGSDVGARVVAEAMSETMRQSMVVENRPGGNVQIALNAVRQAEPDGYTVIWGGAAPMSVQPLMDPKLSGLEKTWDPMADFAVVELVGRYDGMFYTGASGPKSMRELLERMRSPSGNVTYGTFSAGSTFDLAQEYLVYLSKGQAIPVRFKGGNEITTELLAGRLTLGMATISPQVLSLIADGKLRGLAVLSKERLPRLPDVPSLTEVGLPEMLDIDWDAWFGVFVRKQTPVPVVEKLNEGARKMLADRKWTQKLEGVGINPYPPAGLRESQLRWEKSFGTTKVMLGKLGQLPK
ncbi:MAG TPA: tripartite tricarboxylate transporter substrate binding protein [Burkholderiales bacterium]|nr:tripartite tricarboxylate transporter substrate binding protein [Burkholderiales bacterium]